uniref:Uncharacterized protein n=1 Tax=Strigamia maritima TaxID=126957 RepID=T1JPG4_STRMM
MMKSVLAIVSLALCCLAINAKPVAEEEAHHSLFDTLDTLALHAHHKRSVDEAADGFFETLALHNLTERSVEEDNQEAFLDAFIEHLEASAYEAEHSDDKQKRDAEEETVELEELEDDDDDEFHEEHKEERAIEGGEDKDCGNKATTPEP